ncbi:hypothetical protein GXM_08140 [Nostoc sphaeroides CCNUC1]|uniref:Uncharacterized protein n=1 Tax=Nostoc sphaeroides CCNUC1 TaxID=2653204 RepID=A0A5P8WEN8_9NOSO|nr:hypothetical protein GXM_08140 [Nostoc sphaeroides CCNUC1]
MTSLLGGSKDLTFPVISLIERSLTIPGQTHLNIDKPESG